MSTVNGPAYAPPPVIGAQQPIKQVAQPTPQKSQVPTPQPVSSAQVNPSIVGGAVIPQGGVAGTPVNQGQGSATTQGQVPGLFSNVASSLAHFDPFSNPSVSNAYQQAQDINSQIAQSKLNEANGTATLLKQAIPLGDQEGQASVLQNQYLKQQAALGSEFQGQSSLYQAGFTGTGQQQNALSSAGNLTQPQVTSYGQTSFDPTTGQFGGNGNGGLPADVMQQYAQMAASGQYAAIPSFITSNPVLNAQLNVAAKGLNANYTPVGARGASSVLQSIPAMQSANTAADGIKNTINSYLQSNPSLNPSDLAAGNLLQQWVQGKQLTDPKYQTLFNYLNEYTNTLAPVLGVGGDPTNLKTQIAQGFVNGAASGQSISQVLDAMSQLATHKITDLQNGAIGGGTSVPNTTSGGGSGGQIQTQAADGNSYTFHQDANGNWVAN